ncbi:hypothetical protein B296_00021861 [Ensete ventricosum]|uniref:Pentatricopeptide repeat-containing protein n=1 Tax=Ensete ventricosum TaxID=4639 RepID=A0A426XV22_ENSVE|nr:hypothetical protein B296_00021861 [Ensete ventricosum]
MPSMIRYSLLPPLPFALPARSLARRWPIHSALALLQRRANTHSGISRTELVGWICRILTLQRFHAIPKLPFDFSDDILDDVLVRLRLDPDACLGFFRIALRQQYFRPNVESYCRIDPMFDDTRAFSKDLMAMTSSSSSKTSVSFVFDTLVKVYKEFSFSPTVFDMLLKVNAEGGSKKEALFFLGQTEAALKVFDLMSQRVIVPNVISYTSLITCCCKVDDEFSILAWSLTAASSVTASGGVGR